MQDLLTTSDLKPYLPKISSNYEINFILLDQINNVKIQSRCCHFSTIIQTVLGSKFVFALSKFCESPLYSLFIAFKLSSGIHGVADN